MQYRVWSYETAGKILSTCNIARVRQHSSTFYSKYLREARVAYTLSYVVPRAYVDEEGIVVYKYLSITVIFPLLNAPSNSILTTSSGPHFFRTSTRQSTTSPKMRHNGDSRVFQRYCPSDDGDSVGTSRDELRALQPGMTIVAGPVSVSALVRRSSGAVRAQNDSISSFKYKKV